MAQTDAQLLEAVEEAIGRRLAGDAYTLYSIRGRQFAFTPVNQLYQMRKELKRSSTAGGGRKFHMGRFKS